MLGGPRVGDHVIARRDLTASFIDAVADTPTIRDGRRGIVREVRRGWWSDRVVVEFDDGLLTRTVEAKRRDVRVALLGRGEESWQWRRDLRVGIRAGLFLVFGLGPLVAIATFFLRGGTLDGLFGALVVEALVFFGEVLRFLGPVFGAIAVIGALVWLKLRS